MMRLPEKRIISNFPAWAGLKQEVQLGFQEVWYLKLNQPEAGKALWLRFTILATKNGFKKIAETWAIFFERSNNGDVRKTAAKQTYDISEFSFSEDQGSTNIKIAGSELCERATKGEITAKGRSIKWDLSIVERSKAQLNMVPETLKKLHLVKNRAETVFEDLLFTGNVVVDGEQTSFKDAPGMQGHLSGPKNGHSWVWGHCNVFLDETDRLVPFVFDGITARSRLPGNLHSPWLSTFFFLYNGQTYHFNSLWDALRSKSSHSRSDWNFQIEKDNMIFQGTASANHRDFAGITYEDTDGSFLYCSNSKLSTLNITIYRNGKLETKLHTPNCAAFEIVSRTQNPYVPLLL